MKSFSFKLTFVIIAFMGILSSCTSIHQSMREPNVRVELSKSDFVLSDQVMAEASCTRIIGIDFKRLFVNKTATIDGGALGISFANIPVIGGFVVDKTTNYALYELMQSNPGYDVVFYPQYETKVVKPIFGIGFLTKITTVKATARLGKLNK